MLLVLQCEQNHEKCRTWTEIWWRVGAIKVAGYWWGSFNPPPCQLVNLYPESHWSHDSNFVLTCVVVRMTGRCFCDSEWICLKGINQLQRLCQALVSEWVTSVTVYCNMQLSRQNSSAVQPSSPAASLSTVDSSQYDQPVSSAGLTSHVSRLLSVLNEGECVPHVQGRINHGTDWSAAPSPPAW